MVKGELGNQVAFALDQVLGYLNFSSGTADPQFMGHLNRLFASADRESAGGPLWAVVTAQLSERLDQLHADSPAFLDVSQARGVLDLLTEHVLQGYLEWHRDLLFHQTGEALFNAFFVARVCEAILRQGPPWDEAGRIQRNAIQQLNDYLGHRPVAVLETQKIEPYRHEWSRPVPLYVRDAGVAHGPHQEMVELAIELLRDTAPDLLRSAYFDPDLLDELSFDARAYDFDHPVNRRPNYHFGQWDPHRIDRQGRYRRFVVQQVTLDALLTRCREPSDTQREELVFEAAAVLAGTMLMGSGVSGSGPDTHDSTVTLSNLLPHIARYRDEFYQRLLASVPKQHRRRLEQEAAERRQPFGGARQHLNRPQLARLRAAQLEHVHLAKIFARMGYPAAASRQATIVPVASARILCQIDCLLLEGGQALRKRELRDAAAIPGRVLDLLHRAIGCGAVIDPWNILGFDAHFSLFPALENSVHDDRADELIQLIDQVFSFFSHVWSESAAVDDQQVSEQIGRQFRETADWWRQFAAHEVANVHSVDPLETYLAAERVTHTLNLWYKGGAAAGDIAFWAPHAEMFDSPKAYALVIEALLDRGDLVTSRALLSHWLCEAERVGLEEGESSFYRLAERWVLELRRHGKTPTELAPHHGDTEDGQAEEGDDLKREPVWPLARKFFDYLEANADQYARAPHFELGSSPRTHHEREGDAPDSALDEDDDEESDLFGAAYEDMVYRDSTDDGVEGSIYETSEDSHDELVRESNRIADRLAFLACLARLWRIAGTAPELSEDEESQEQQPPTCYSHVDALRRWKDQAAELLRQLGKLLQDVRGFRILTPTGDHDSMLQYDRQRIAKESLLERIILTSVEVADAARVLMAAAAAAGHDIEDQADDVPMLEEQAPLIGVTAALLRGEPRHVRRRWPALLAYLRDKPLLYLPLARGGDPSEIVAARVRQRALQDLMVWLPRRGLLVETCQLIETARRMERDNPVGPGAVTEFDELFKSGCKSLTETLVASSETWNSSPRSGDEKEHRSRCAAQLVECLERLIEAMLLGWLTHSRTLRLSVLERVNDDRRWKKLVDFIKTYGQDLFTQHFLNLGNVRAILHHGVDAWLQRLVKQPPEAAPLKLIDDLERKKISQQDASEQLGLVLEAIVENYGEYRDYNSTTTQSDNGAMLYTLLDFLRLRSQYDRVCWNLKPVVLAHEILVRRGKDTAARLWRRALNDRVRGEAEQYLQRLGRLQKKYAMRMPTVADRLAERFLRPLQVDRMCALVEPAIQRAGEELDCPPFELLERETAAMTRQPTGVGLDTPPWLASLEDEVEKARRPAHEKAAERQLKDVIPQRRLSLKEVKRQLTVWASKR